MLCSRRAFVGGIAGALLSRCHGGSNPSEPTPSTGGTSTGSGSSGPVLLNEGLSGRQLFPRDNWWHLDVSGAPLDPGSDDFIDAIGRSRSLHPDFGPPPYGIPFVTVAGNQPRVPVRFVDYPEESDSGAPGAEPGYPIPNEARSQPNLIEGGEPGGGGDGDRHLLVVDRDRWILFETWATHWNGSESVWEAGSGAVFDLNRNDRRPEGWTSADAAGLAILPGLVRADEAFGDDIRHAFRVTLRSTNGYVWPASHEAGNADGALPMGARLRLNAGVDVSGFPSYVQTIFRAMKRYGLIVADNGGDLFITGTMDSRWNNDELNPAFSRLRASDFEVVELGFR